MNLGPDTVSFSASTARSRIESSISTAEVMRAAARHPHRSLLPSPAGAGLRVDWFRAKDQALKTRMSQIGTDASEPFVQEVIAAWCRMSGLARDEAGFWREAGFRSAIEYGHDIQLHRYLGDDGWAWISVRSSGGSWLSRKRLPEAVRQEMLRVKQRRREGPGSER